MGKRSSPEKMTNFGRMVCLRLNELGMTQKELAQRICLNSVYLNRILYGECPVQMRVLIMIANEIGMDKSRLAEAVLSEKE